MFGVKRMDVKQRKNFLDILRVAATCAVVLLHTVTGVMDAADMSLFPVQRKVFLVVMDLVCWCVPVFLLISGYLFLNPGRSISFRTMVTKYCRRIVLALFLFGVPYACLEQMAAERSFHPKMIWEGFLMVLRGQSWSHMWYLYLIFFLYLLTPALRLILEKLPRGAVYLLLAVLFAGSSILPFIKGMFGPEWLPALPDWGIYFFYYICGYLFATGKRFGLQERKTGGAGPEGEFPADGGRMRTGKRSCLTAACVLAFAMAVSRIAGFSFQMAYNYPFTVVLALLLFTGGDSAGKGGQRENLAVEAKEQGTCTRKRGIVKNTGFWENASALSFGVYLVHPVFLNIYYKFLHVTPLSFSILLSLPLFFLGSLLPAAFAAWVLRKVPPLRKYVL